MKRAQSLVADVSDLNSFICGVVLLGDCIARRDEVQKASNELLRCFHVLCEEQNQHVDSSANRREHGVVLATVLQRLLLYSRAHGLSARVHLGSACPLAAVVQLWQHEQPPVVQAAALELVADLCLFEDFNVALDSTDLAVAVRLLDQSTEADVRRGALKVLLALVSPSVPRDLRDKRKSLLSANQVRPRLVKLLRQELLADVQESAAELLMRVVATSDDGSSISTGPSSDEFLAAPLTGPMPRISPTPNRTKSSVGLSPASSSSVASSGPAPSPAKTPMQPRKLQLSEESFDYSDFIALLSVTGPVAVQACSMLQVSLSQGGLPAAKAFRGQRGVERMVYLVLDLLEPVRVQADWSIRARKHALSTLQQVVQCDSGCCDCFLESFGAELSIIVLASDRINQDIAVSLLETIANKGSREQRLVEVLLGSVRPQNTVNRPSGFASSMSKARQELEACKGSPNDASRTLLALAAEGFDLRQCARVLHSRCFSCGLGCPGVEDLRTELLEERDERIRAQQSEARQQAEQQKLRVTLEAERERAATEARLAQEAAERSARIRSEAEQMRRKLLAEADVEAAKARAAALLELEVLSVQKRHELEREERFLNLREETQRRTQEMAGRINNLMQEVAELKGKERNYLDMIESQKELIAQLSKVSEQLYASETPVDQRKFSV